jgi:hypothetical protein
MGADLSNAIYTLGYESEGGEGSWEKRAGLNKLFIAGGPLQLACKGSYAGIFTM